MLQHEGIQITWLGHDGFKLKKGKVVYVDPFKLGAKPEPADLVFVTHEHFDHLSVDDLKKVVTPATTIVTIAACEAAVKPLKPKAVRLVAPGDRLTVDGVTVEVLPAYNVNKFRAPGQVFHAKTDAHVGFVFRMDGTRVYFAGDTDFIPEMKSIRCDIALLPVSGTYVMTAEEAAEAVAALRPRIAVPMHYAAIVGSDSDAQKFKSLVKNCQVEVI